MKHSLFFIFFVLFSFYTFSAHTSPNKKVAVVDDNNISRDRSLKSSELYDEFKEKYFKQWENLGFSREDIIDILNRILDDIWNSAADGILNSDKIPKNWRDIFQGRIDKDWEFLFRFLEGLAGTITNSEDPVLARTAFKDILEYINKKMIEYQQSGKLDFNDLPEELRDVIADLCAYSDEIVHRFR